MLQYCQKIEASLPFLDPQGEAYFKWLQPVFEHQGERFLTLLQAACHLAELGHQELSEYQGLHTMLRVARMPFVGLSHTERAFLGLVLYARYNGTIGREEADEIRRLLPEKYHALAVSFGSAIALAREVGFADVTALKSAEWEVRAGETVLRFADKSEIEDLISKISQGLERPFKRIDPDA